MVLYNNFGFNDVQKDRQPDMYSPVSNVLISLTLYEESTVIDRIQGKWTP